MSCGLVPKPTTSWAPLYHHTHPPKLQGISLSKKPFKSAAVVGCSFKRKATVEDQTSSSFYELLGISEEVSFDEIKRAYKQLARKYHPDVSPPDRTEEFTRRFIEVQEAYEILSDPSLRAIYDKQYLARGLHLAFSSRTSFHQELKEMSQWKNRWQVQVTELKRRSMNKDSEENLSWGARMRHQRATRSSPEQVH